MGIQSRNLNAANGYHATIAAISATSPMQGGKVLPGAGRTPGTAVIQYNNGAASAKTVSVVPVHMTLFTGESYPGLRLSQDEVMLMANLAEELRACPSPRGSGLKKKKTDH